MANALILKSWDCNPTAENGNTVHIEARQPGLVAWILDKVGVSTVTKLAIEGNKVIFAQGNFAGNIHASIPVKKITSVTYGNSKPFTQAIALGAVLAVPTFGLGIIIAIIYYFLQKQIRVGITVSSIDYSLVFKEGNVGGQKIGLENAREVAEQISKLI